MRTTMEKLGITASYSRPRVSNDNPFSEALFRTCKYRPDWPNKGFATKADAQAWVPYFKALEPDTYAIVGEPFTTALVGIPILKTSDGTALRAAVKGALDAMQADGSYDAILAKYELQGNALRPITENMGH